MTEHKFTDEEVIKALEVCDIASNCDECPYKDYSRCNEVLAHDALDLINRQKAEIERLLQKTQKPQAEAVKEFADRLKTYYRNLDKTAGGLVEYHIDQIAKEFLERGAADSKDNN